MKSDCYQHVLLKIIVIIAILSTIVLIIISIPRGVTYNLSLENHRQCKHLSSCSIAAMILVINI